MKRKTMIPVLIFALSVTVLVVVANIRGGLFQSSLLTDNDGVTVGSGSQFSASLLATATGTELEEFPLYAERTEVYRAALLGTNGNNNIGFYFPSIYKFTGAGQGLVNIAFRPGTDVLVEKSLRLTVSYPSRAMRYIGETVVSASGARMTVDAVSQPNQLIIEMVPSEGEVWRFSEEVNPFLSLPMEIGNTDMLLPNTGLQLRIVETEHVGFDNTSTAWPHAQAPVDILYYMPATDPATRPVPTGEVRVPGERGVLTMEMKPAPAAPVGVGEGQINTPTAAAVTTGVQAFRLPLVTQDQTRISPPLIRERSRETVFVYLSATDPDGQSDLKAVEMDLSLFGLAARVPLVQVSTGPKYTVFGGSFTLPDSVVSRATPYEIPYSVMDGGSNVVKGTLKFVVRPAATEADTTTSTSLNSSTGVTGVSLLNETSTQTNTSGRPAALDVETDLNGDGKVDDTDLAIYLFTFNLDRD